MNKYQDALTRLKHAIDMLYSLSKFYWDIGYGIIGKEPKPIISEEEIKLFTDLIDRATPKKPSDFVEASVKNSGYYCLDFTCGNCNKNSYRQPYKPNFCKHCGQAIDWRTDE